MNIKFYGQACFSISEGGNTVVTDPFNDSIGLKLPTLNGNVVTISNQKPAHNNSAAVEGARVLDWPGEFETAGIHFKGIASFGNDKDDKEQGENTVFTMQWNGIRLCHLGGQGTKLTPEQLEAVGDVDILFVPVGGKDSIDAKKAKEVIEQIEPRVVVPMTYDTDGSTAGNAGLAEFLDQMGAKGTEPVESFSVKKSELPQDNSKVVIVNPAMV